MFAVKSVVAWVGDQNQIEAATLMGEKLKSRGIGFLCRKAECFPHTKSCAGACEPEDGRFLPGQTEGILYITDTDVIFKKLQSLDCPVLVWLHEGNCEQRFPGARYACEELQELDGEFMDGIYRRCRKLPWNIVETERCLVRETVPEDAEAFCEIYGDPSVTAYTERIRPDAEQEKRYIEEYIEKVYGFYNFGVWTILEKESGQIIGRAGFALREGYEIPEIGYVIGLPWQGKGYAWEVCRSILNYARKELGFSGVQAFVSPDNKASLALCAKLGLEKKERVQVDGRECLRLELILGGG